jgi:pyruvate formate lyase activating enzyme
MNAIAGRAGSDLRLAPVSRPGHPITGIKGFLETSFLDWRGKVCSVIFLGGCNFRCPYCHNRSLVLDPDGLTDVPWDTILAKIQGLRGWVDGLCITGGEPTCHCMVEEMIKEIRSYGFPVKLDTNGSHPEVLEALIGRRLLEAVSMDIKAPLRPEAYARCAGRPVSLDRVRKSIRILSEAGIEVEFRTTVVPGLVGEEDLLEIARLLPRETTYRIQGFRSQVVLDPALSSVAPCTEEEVDLMSALVAQARSLSAEDTAPHRIPTFS